MSTPCTITLLNIGVSRRLWNLIVRKKINGDFKTMKQKCICTQWFPYTSYLIFFQSIYANHYHVWRGWINKSSDWYGYGTNKYLIKIYVHLDKLPSCCTCSSWWKGKAQAQSCPWLVTKYPCIMWAGFWMALSLTPAGTERTHSSSSWAKVCFISNPSVQVRLSPMTKTILLCAQV